ncbi:hypothetical protein U9M48_033872 [Paspalum notatum var. saurae]|uniref:Uncharacterized protein n=1 Tax=Paspalum notatum var. saurae TaxID=547442 RepID=A0AAQ3X855_PASNO
MWFPFLNKLTIKHCPHIIYLFYSLNKIITHWIVEIAGNGQLFHLRRCNLLKNWSWLICLLFRQLTVPFLKKLILIQLPNLECCTSLNGVQLSHNIEVLQIVKCCKLICFPVLQVHDCPRLTVSCPLPPSAELPHSVSVSIRGVSAPPAMKMHKDWSSFTIESEELRVLDETVVAFGNLASTRIYETRLFRDRQ